MMEIDIVRNTGGQTPIEVLLQVGEDGRVSSKSVYEFLNMLPNHYARWCRINIVENQFAEENVDFSILTIGGEQVFGGAKATTDYRLSVPFAKKLCMLARSERGDQARNYFIKVEETLKNVAQNLPQLTTSEMLLQLAQNNVMLEREMRETREEVRRIEGKVDTAVKVFAKPGVNWKDSMEIAIRDLIGEGTKFDLIKLKGQLYTELEVRTSCDLGVRQTRLRNRLKKQGATHRERVAVTKMDVISKDKHLRVVFEGLVRNRQAVRAMQGYEG